MKKLLPAAGNVIFEDLGLPVGSPSQAMAGEGAERPALAAPMHWQAAAQSSCFLILRNEAMRRNPPFFSIALGDAKACKVMLGVS